MTSSSTPDRRAFASLSVCADRALLRSSARSRRYLLVSVVAPEAPARAERLPVNIALVLDRSGSMGGARKFELAREAVEQALRMLHPEDRFTLVVYDEAVEVLAPSTPATPDAKRRALDALRQVGPRGSTDLFAGWMRGCEQIADYLTDDGITRALLLTDGLANHGTTDRATLARHASELRQRGIATSTFGVGDDFDERLLRDIAHEGGGHFYFIETPAQIPDLLTSELGEALEVVMRRAALHVVLPPRAEGEPLNRFRFTRAEGDNELRVELGDLTSGQEIEAVIALRFPTGEIGARSAVRVVLGSDDVLASHAEGQVEFTYATHEANDQQPRNRAVDRAVARLYASRARADATEANRHGDLMHARRLLERTARRIRDYAGDDAALREIVAELRAELPHFAEAAMDAKALKMAMFSSEAMSKGRDPQGKARRR